MTGYSVVMTFSIALIAMLMTSSWVATIASSITTSPASVRNKMGHIEFFRIDDEGAGWVDLSEATPAELIDLEIGLFQEGAL
jgi:hypothetical protein